MARAFPFLLAAVTAAACNSGPPGVPASSAADAGEIDAAIACDTEQRLCLDHDTSRVCIDGRWIDMDCEAGSGCVQGQCQVAACSDECRLGESEGDRGCELYDMSSGEWTVADSLASLHDRARDYTGWLHRDSLAFGGVGSAVYADPGTYEHVESLRGLGDSAIWTGTYLAAEALRLRVTGAADARANVISLVETLHLWFNVSGDPGLLARFVVPSDAPRPVELTHMRCEARRGHCGVLFDGRRYDYLGHVSRDQYQGVMLGYALAYEALGPHDEATRRIIRDDVVEFVGELMRERTVPVIISVDGTRVGPIDLDLRFVVLHQAEMIDGSIVIEINTDDPNESDAYGFQEFIPNMSDIIHQVPLLDWVPDIPRAGSAVMLASFFQVAMLVTDGIEELEAEHEAFKSFYEGNDGLGGNIDDWLDLAETLHYPDECGKAYYGNNIVMEPMYNLARLEADPERSLRILDDVLYDQMWSQFRTAKNSFFAFIFAGTHPDRYAPAVPVTAAEQLAQFPPPPRIKVAVDLRDDPNYSEREPDCNNQLSHGQALDVAVRPAGDFLWQRHPWSLYDPGDPAQTYPGIDYLVAYWLGRHHEFIDDDSSGRCLVWRDSSTR